MTNKNALFELSTDAETYRGGDVVTGRAIALDKASRPVVLELVFNDQSGVGETAATMSVDGGVSAGEVISFEFVLPDDALTGYMSLRAQLGWAVQARYAHTRQTRQRDLLFLDVENSRSPIPGSPPREMARGHETVGFMGRGRKTEKWDVSARLLTPEVPRGGTAELQIEAPSGALASRPIEVGLTCEEHWMTVPRGDDNATRRSEIVCQQFEPLTLTDSGVVSVAVPTNGPFSWHRSPLEDEIVHRTAGFTWLAIVREGHPNKGPQKVVELTVLP